MGEERCPLCAAVALYVGLERLECPTADCPNACTRAEPALGEQLRLALDLRPTGRRLAGRER